MNATSKFDDLYPDLARDGGGINALQNAQQLALRSISSHLEVKAVVFTVRVEKNLRFSQVSLAAEERLFLCDFWDRGVMLAKANTPDLFQVA